MDPKLHRLYETINTPSLHLDFRSLEEMVEQTPLGDLQGVREGFDRRDWRALSNLLGAHRTTLHRRLPALALQLMSSDTVTSEIVTAGIIIAACNYIVEGLDQWLSQEALFHSSENP